MIISIENKIRGSTSVDLSKRIVVLPLSHFLFLFLFFLFFCIFLRPQWLFLFNSHLSSLGSFNCVHFGIFSSLKGNTLFYKKVKEIFHTLQGTQNHKEDITIMMYAMYASTFSSLKGNTLFY